MNRKLAAALSGAALVLAVAGCGGNDNTAALNSWSKEVCDSVKPQVQSATKALNDIARVKPDEKPADLKKRLSADIDTVSQSYAELAAGIDEAGAPPVDNGQQLQENAVQELKGSAKSYAGLKKQVDALDTKDQASFAQGLTKVSDQVTKLGSQSSDALDKLQSGEVGKAMAKQPGCQTASTAPSVPPSPSKS